MFVRSIFANYYKLLTGASIALLAIALVGCNEKVAEKSAPGRPVLVATVHYEAESPERSFVGTIRPRIETDMGFRVPGKVAKRLVEVGQTVDVGQPLATLDEVDLKLQAEQAQAEFSAATGVLAQAAASETRAKDLRVKGWTTDAQMDQARAAADEARARLNRAERSVELTKNSLVLRDAGCRYPRRRHLDPDRRRTSRGVRADRDPRRALCREGSRGRHTRNSGRAREGWHGLRDAVVRAEQEIRRKTARDRARCRSRDAHLSGKILAARCRRQGLARHDRDADAGRSRHRARRAGAAVGAVFARRRSLALYRRRMPAT